MTEPSNAAKRKACELELKQHGVGQIVVDPLTAEYIKGLRRAFALYIDEVDRTAREVEEWLDSVKCQSGHKTAREVLSSLMLPDGPDPLREAWMALWPSSEHNLPLLRAELDKRGLTIAPKEQGRLTDGIL